MNTAHIFFSVLQIRQCKLRRQLFPAKRRYFTNLLPGIALAGAGLIMFAFLETSSNYKYVHSAWHVVISLSIVFLLPQRRNNKGNSLSNSPRRFTLENYTSETNGGTNNTNSGDGIRDYGLDNVAYYADQSSG